MQPRVFSAPWFARHQRSLRVALNTPGLGRELRAALGVQPTGRLVRLLPHANVVRHGPVYVADFRTHARVAKRLYHTGLPLWQLLHWFDQRLANPFVPAFNLGFDTLTAFPDADPETTTVDGIVNREGVDESWATLIAGAGNGAADNVSPLHAFRFDASTTLNQFTRMRRSIYLFDTSSIGSGSTITAAVLSLFDNNRGDPRSNAPTTDIYTSTPASNTALVSGDYGQLGTTSQTGAALAFASITNFAYNDFTFSATGRGNVSKTSVSKFGARNANFDVAAVQPTWGSGDVTFWDVLHADAAGTTSDPKLVVTYTPAAVGAGRAGFSGFQAAVALAQGWD